MYCLDFRNDGVYIIFEKSLSEMDDSDKKIIIQKVKRKNLDGFQINTLLQALYKGTEQMVKLAPPQDNRLLDEEAIVRVSPDQMEAYILFHESDGGKILSSKDIISLLAAASVTFGIKSDVLDKLSISKTFSEEILIAEGKPAQHGQDASLKYHIDINKKASPKVYEDGQIDYRILDNIENVVKDQILVSLIPPTTGFPGRTVLDKEILPKSGKSLSLPRGKNTLIAEDNLALVSAIEGKVEIFEKKVNVFALHEVRENVDNSTGNIDFVGNVVVNGNVLSGFVVKAGGSIEIKGVVEGANLIAGGNIILKRGAQGMGKGAILSGGNVIARFIESANVNAKGDVLAEAIMHSSIYCGGKIKVAGKKGLIVGGKLHAGQSVSALTVGSPMATFTEIEVGIDPEIRKEYDQLKKEIEEMQIDAKKAEQILVMFSKMEENGRQLPVDKQILKAKARKTVNSLSEKLQDSKIRIIELEEIILAVGESKVSVKQTVYPGVSIAIGSSSIRIKDTLHSPTFKREHGEVRVVAYQPI